MYLIIIVILIFVIYYAQFFLMDGRVIICVVSIIRYEQLYAV